MSEFTDNITRIQNTVMDQAAKTSDPTHRLMMIAKVELITRLLGYAEDLKNKAGKDDVEASALGLMAWTEVLGMFLIASGLHSADKDTIREAFTSTSDIIKKMLLSSVDRHTETLAQSKREANS